MEMSLHSMNALHILHPEEQTEHHLKLLYPICHVKLPSQITRFLILRSQLLLEFLQT